MIDNTRVHRTMRNTPARRSKKRGTALPPETRLTRLYGVMQSLKYLLKLTKEADAPMLAGRIRAAIKSAGGAVRHARGREFADYAESRRIEEDCDREVLVIHGDMVDGPIKAGP